MEKIKLDTNQKYVIYIATYINGEFSYHEYSQESYSADNINKKINFEVDFMKNCYEVDVNDNEILSFDVKECFNGDIVFNVQITKDIKRTHILKIMSCNHKFVLKNYGFLPLTILTSDKEKYRPRLYDYYESLFYIEKLDPSYTYDEEKYFCTIHEKKSKSFSTVKKDEIKSSENVVPKLNPVSTKTTKESNCIVQKKKSNHVYNLLNICILFLCAIFKSNNMLFLMLLLPLTITEFLYFRIKSSKNKFQSTKQNQIEFLKIFLPLTAIVYFLNCSPYPILLFLIIHYVKREFVKRYKDNSLYMMINNKHVLDITLLVYLNLILVYINLHNIYFYAYCDIENIFYILPLFEYFTYLSILIYHKIKIKKSINDEMDVLDKLKNESIEKINI